MKELLSHESVDENLRFLIVEVLKQVERTQRHFEQPSSRVFDNLLSRDDYIDNLKNLIQRKVLKYAVEVPAVRNKAQVHLLNSVDVVSVNLERIADFCVNVVDQLGYIQDKEVLDKVDFAPFFDEVIGGLSKIEHALFDGDIQEATLICRSEGRLDTLYADVFRRMLAELDHGTRSAQSLVTLIFIAHYFERMGDSLLNVGEAIISACLGEPVKIGQFLALEDSLKEADLPQGADDVSLDAYLGTRSGHRIARVSSRQDDGSRMVIFKEGRTEKLREEVASVRRWEELVEGLAPKVYSFHERGDTGAILFEYLPGRTLESMILEGDTRELDRVVGRIAETVSRVWEKTRHDEGVKPRFLAQLDTRLPDVFAIHPEYRDEARRIGDVEILSIEQLVEAVRPFDEILDAPFSVFVHGDFNVDNIIYDPMADRVRFIDLHRSRQSDYVQDVSTFLVSNFRLQVFRAPVRRRIFRVVRRFHDFASAFAARHGDATFSARLALGLARSFLTSTRFVLDPNLSRSMMLKSRYLLERLAAADPARLDRFDLPGDVFIG